jgi:hypothetical protein
MADYSVEIPLPDHKRGDRWPGIASVGPVLINGAIPPAPLTRVRMHFLHSGGRKDFKLDSSSAAAPAAPILITDAANWVAQVPEVQNFLSLAGRWSWDMEFYQADKTSPLTLYKGHIEVLSDITF